MARAPMVTRTIKTTHATLMCVDTESAEVCNKDVVLPRTYESENDALKAAQKRYQTDTFKVVAVVASKVSEALYGMSEADFIAHAKELPPRSATADEANADTGDGETSGLLED